MHVLVNSLRTANDDTSAQDTNYTTLISIISAIQLKIQSSRKAAHAQWRSRKPEVPSVTPSSAQTQ